MERELLADAALVRESLRILGGNTAPAARCTWTQPRTAQAARSRLGVGIPLGRGRRVPPLPFPSTYYSVRETETGNAEGDSVPSTFVPAVPSITVITLTRSLASV